MGRYTLSEVAMRSFEVLQMSTKLPRGSRQPTDEALIAKPYVKVLTALIELEEGLIAANVDISEPARERAPARPSLPLALIETVPLPQILTTTAPQQSPKGFSMDLFFGERLRWLFLVYLPSFAVVVVAVTVTLAFSHMAMNPDAMFDAFWNSLGYIPEYFTWLFKRLAAAAYNRLFSKNVTPVKRLEIAPPQTTDDGDGFRAIIPLLMILTLGWVLSWRPPARPANSTFGRVGF